MGPEPGIVVASKAPNGVLISVVLADKSVDSKPFAKNTNAGPGEPLVAGLFEGASKEHIAKKFSGVTFTLGRDAVLQVRRPQL